MLKRAQLGVNAEVLWCLACGVACLLTGGNGLVLLKDEFALLAICDWANLVLPVYQGLKYIGNNLCVFCAV
jgi:hypothetical protein